MKIKKPITDIQVSGQIFHTNLGNISVVDDMGQGWGMGINLERRNVTPDDLRKLADYMDSIYKHSTKE